MKSILLVGLDDDQQKELRGDFKSSRILRHRLIDVLRQKIETNRTSLRDKENYDKASWSFYQADGMGYERSIVELISLLEDDK